MVVQGSSVSCAWSHYSLNEPLQKLEVRLFGDLEVTSFSTKFFIEISTLKISSIPATYCMFNSGIVFLVSLI